MQSSMQKVRGGGSGLTAALGRRTTTGHAHLAQALHGYGVSHTFMVPTVAVPALAEMSALGIVGVMTHGEKSAAYMADGYARATGRPSVCLAQSVGSANLAAGLREPWLMGSPVIAITGGRDPLTSHRHLYQETEDFELYRRMTKFNAEVDDVRRVPDLLRQAFRAATTGRPGPVHLQLRGRGGEMLGDELEADAPVAEPRFAAAPPFRPVPDDAALRDALDLLAAGERPVILAGGGARVSGAHAVLLALAERLGIPVATSFTGKGLVDERHPLALGCLGSTSRPSANRAVAEADVVLVVGSRLGSQVTDNYRLPKRQATVIQLDLDPQELGRNHPNAVSLLGDARAGLARLLELSDTSGDHAAWRARAAGFVREFRAEKAPLLASDARPIRPERLCHELGRALPADAVVVVDTGHSGLWTAPLLDLLPSHTFLRAGGTLGWAFPAALGAKCAVGERHVVCFTGDGGFYYHLAELETAARHGIAAVIVVNDNVSLSQDMQHFEGAFGGPGDPACERMWRFRDVSLAEVARELGCFGARVEAPEEIAGALAEALVCGRPAVVEVMTDVMALPDIPYGGVEFYSR
jgi:acetolactate synthase-1/2/3 large subunit